MDEARAFCEYYSKRLPHEYEWQLAAQGTDGRPFPWGDEVEGPSNFTRVPTPCSRTECKNIDLFEPTKVGSFSPAGDSPSGMRDAIGNVWQYVDQFIDDHTEHVMLKGGSSYDLQNIGGWSDMEDWQNQSPGLWYFSQAKWGQCCSRNGVPSSIARVDAHNKWMRMSDSFDRASTVGFRCVKDHQDGAPGPYHVHKQDEEQITFLS